MVSEIEFDATSQPEGKASEAVACTARNAGRTDAAHHEWSRPRIPVFQDVLVREIAMELVQDRLFIWGRGATFQMNDTD